MMIVDSDLLSMQKARILAENAFEAQRRLASFTQEQLDAIVEAVADAVEGHARALAVQSQEETGYGRWQDKYLKNRFVCDTVRMRLRGMRCVGVIGEDRERRLLDIGVPVGVVVALCPVTSPVSTTIHNALIAIKSGNAIIFSPHPRACGSIGKVLEIMSAAACAHGLPEGALACLDTVTRSGTRELMRHPAVSLVMVTGVPGMVREARDAGKSVICGGTGHGPAFIERTADVNLAVRDIIASKTFDNGIASSAEQSIVADACIEQEVRRVLRENGAYFMSEEESHRLGALFFCADGRRNPAMVGLAPAALARRAGFCVPEETTVLVADRRYVSVSDPYCRELLCPVLALYVEDDWMHACEKCIELLVHERSAHTLVIHSKDEEVIRQFALRKPVARLLVNTPSTFGGMGATTNLFPSMTLGSGSTGQGITSDNVSPLHLVYTRRVGYGVRDMDGTHYANGTAPGTAPGTAAGATAGDLAATGQADILNKEDCNSIQMQALHRLLQEAIRAMDGSASGDGQ